MSITTKKGDDGSTGLLYGRRVPKNHVRIEALGSVDELSAALGFAKIVLDDDARRAFLHGVQLDLIAMMGELAVDSVEHERKPFFRMIDEAAVEALDARVKISEAALPPHDGSWDIPGANEAQARLHLARVACRRAERAVWAVLESDPGFRRLPGRYLNRFSDVLWLMAREVTG